MPEAVAANTRTPRVATPSVDRDDHYGRDGELRDRNRRNVVGGGGDDDPLEKALPGQPSVPSPIFPRDVC